MRMLTVSKNEAGSAGQAAGKYLNLAGKASTE